MQCGNAVQAYEKWARTTKEKVPHEDELKHELDAIHQAGGCVLVWGEADYPPLLDVLSDPPVVLSVLGDARLLTAQQVGVVGNRNASGGGLQWTRTLATDLARAGVVVTSGLARGIDTAAHEGALAAGGKTIAVVAGGVDHIYPPENKTLRARMLAEGGAIISEQRWGGVPAAGLFPRRNRIIAGLSVGVVVSEATRHSGSLITAEHALNYGREVWAVPGSPADPRASGPNWLLKQGATLVEGAADILASIPSVQKVAKADVLRKLSMETLPLLRETETPEDEEDSPAGEAHAAGLPPALRVLQLLGKVPLDVDQLVREVAVSEAELLGILTELEMEGSATRAFDGRWLRA